MDNSQKGPVGNRIKKRDNVSDTMPSFKRDTEANIGEFFYSRETLKLSYKKGVGQFVRFGDTQPPSTLPYKVYTALLTQSGIGSIKTVGNTSGGAFKQTNSFYEGATYEIIANPNNTDLSLLGAHNNLAGTKFISLLDADLNDYNLDVAVVLSYNQGAPRAKVLENTLEANITYDYVDMGNYLAISDKVLFDSPNAYLKISNQAYVANGNYFAAQAIPVFFNAFGILTSQNAILEDNVITNSYAATILEIRIYNDTII